MRLILCRVGYVADGKGTGAYQIFGEVAGGVFEPVTVHRLRAVDGCPEDLVFNNEPAPLENAMIRLKRVRDALTNSV